MPSVTRSPSIVYFRMMRVTLILICACVLCHAETLEDKATPLSKAQVAELLGSDRASSLTWKKVVGTDCTVYYGRNNGKSFEVVGIYLGGFPAFASDASLPKKPGQLGMYTITWQRRDNPKRLGVVRWETV